MRRRTREREAERERERRTPAVEDVAMVAFERSIKAAMEAVRLSMARGGEGEAEGPDTQLEMEGEVRERERDRKRERAKEVDAILSWGAKDSLSLPIPQQRSVHMDERERREKPSRNTRPRILTPGERQMEREIQDKRDTIAEKCYRIVEEMIETEANYNRTLGRLISHMSSSEGEGEGREQGATTEGRERESANLLDVVTPLKIQSDLFLESMPACVRDLSTPDLGTCIGGVLIGQRGPLVSAYTAYTVSYSDIKAYLERRVTQRVDSILIAPIQRLPRVRLLLRELARERDKDITLAESISKGAVPREGGRERDKDIALAESTTSIDKGAVSVGSQERELERERDLLSRAMQCVDGVVHAMDKTQRIQDNSLRLSHLVSVLSGEGDGHSLSPSAPLITNMRRQLYLTEIASCEVSHVEMYLSSGMSYVTEAEEERENRGAEGEREPLESENESQLYLVKNKHDRVVPPVYKTRRLVLLSESVLVVKDDTEGMRLKAVYPLKGMTLVTSNTLQREREGEGEREGETEEGADDGCRVQFLLPLTPSSNPMTPMSNPMTPDGRDAISGVKGERVGSGLKRESSVKGLRERWRDSRGRERGSMAWSAGDREGEMLVTMKFSTKDVCADWTNQVRQAKITANRRSQRQSRGSMRLRPLVLPDSPIGGTSQYLL
ncbi:hypothetical protein KIPB_002887 [Kipferlia bialata]|uniref:DH domain-containing protein n=1 Tax=Kipferlia bialata TaxID=797122 RepID=A0A9K3GFD2_9EUKA|nr:hypothetical protein KIPB_002887 [Kipferlia bialata]|eukprot:g2887.t1